MVETLIDDEGELRHGSSTDLLPPQKPRRELHRRTSGTAPEHQDDEPPKEREDDLIRGDAALHLPYKAPQLPPEQSCKEDEAEDAQDLANKISKPTPILHEGKNCTKTSPKTRSGASPSPTPASNADKSGSGSARRGEREDQARVFGREREG